MIASPRSSAHTLIDYERRRTLRQFAAALLAMLPLLGLSPSALLAQQLSNAPTPGERTPLPSRSLASAAPDDAWRVTLTIFRSPGTGLQVSRGRWAAFVAHYPTILTRGDEANRTTHFVRSGVAVYGSDGRWSPYASLSWARSLSDGWSNGALVDVGGRWRATEQLSAQLGAAVLRSLDGRTRVNPTVGLGLRR